MEGMRFVISRADRNCHFQHTEDKTAAHFVKLLAGQAQEEEEDNRL